jgi:alkyl hydroperoxide reductase subunit AhpC
MTLRLGDEAPDFTALTTHGTIRFHEWMEGHWTILFSHPKNFTPVCTTELGTMARLAPRFAERGCRIIGLSTDPIGEHRKWLLDIESTQGAAVGYPVIADADLLVSKRYGMIHPHANPGGSAADNATIRSVFVIGPDRRIRAMIAYPMSTGRSFDELLRLLDSLQLTEKHGVATPANWKPGEDVIIPAGVSNEEAKRRYPQGWRTLTPYLRTVRLDTNASSAGARPARTP